MRSYTYFALAFIILCSCGKGEDNGVVFGDLKEISVPCVKGMAPNLFSAHGHTYLSWIEFNTDTSYALQFSKLEEGNWSIPSKIASGTDWFVNWADFPSLVTYKNDPSKMAAHWLQMSADGTYDYDIQVSQSTDSGRTWSKPFTLHRDGVNAEHGFVSMMPLGTDRIFATWLDGRNTKDQENSDNGSSHGHGGGAMSLRAATFDSAGNLYDEIELDDRVCDCCQTSVAPLEDGIIVAYRNRSEGEIRDINVVRKVRDDWLLPQLIHEDNWMINGCPVNGPVVRSAGDNVAVAWFTMNDTIPEVKVAFSNNSGKSFDKVVKIDEGNPLGRVDLEFINDKQVLVTWLEASDGGTRILAVPILTNGQLGSSIEVNETQSSRSSGFTRMEINNKEVIFAWTDASVVNRVRAKVITL